MINFSLVKYVLVCAFLFSLVPLKSYAIGCDYRVDNNLKIYSVEVDHYNDRVWVNAIDPNKENLRYLVNLDNYIKDSMLMTMANTSVLFGYKVNICSYSYGSYYQLYSIEVGLR